jgi:hypothetical protein
VASTAILVDQSESHLVSDKWLYDFWCYISEKDAMGLVRDFIPLLPVLSPPGEARQLLALISNRIPVLQPFQQTMPPELYAALAQCGVYIVSEKHLGQMARHPKLMGTLHQSDAAGVLAALASKIEHVVRTLPGAEEAAVDSLRLFLCDGIQKSFDTSYAETLRVLPVWKVFSRNCQKQFVSLRSGNFVLPPPGVNFRLLDESFLLTDKPCERQTLLRLGTKEMNAADFYTDYVIPLMDQPGKELDDAALSDETFISILRDLKALRAQQPAIIDKLRSCTFVPNGRGERLPPHGLFDPREEELTRLLSDASFPDQHFRSAELLSSLKVLGLQDRMNCDGVLRSALDIARDCVSGDLEVVRKAKSRSLALIRFLEKHAEALLKESDPTFLQAYLDATSHGLTIQALVQYSQQLDPGSAEASEFRSARFSASIESKIDHTESPVQSAKSQTNLMVTATTAGSQSGDSRNSAQSAENPAQTDVAVNVASSTCVKAMLAGILMHDAGAEFGERLRSTLWVEVLTTPPQTIPRSFPWDSSFSQSPIAQPSVTRPASDQFLISRFMRLPVYDVSSEPALCLLGWHRPPPAKLVAMQLVEVSRFFKAADRAGKDRTIALLTNEVPRMYMILQSAIVSSAQEHSDVKSTLSSHEWVFTGDDFVEPSCVALQSALDLDMKPFRYTIPPDFEAFTALFRECGVKNTFEPCDLVEVLQILGRKHEDAPLTPAHHALALKAIKLISTLPSEEVKIVLAYLYCIILCNMNTSSSNAFTF